MRTLQLLTCLCGTALLMPANPAESADKPPRVEFTRMIAHWARYGDDDYLKFVQEARPDVAQIGFYGGHFWSLAHTPQYKGYPAHFPVQGLKECGDWFVTRNKGVKKLGVKVVGHFNVEFLVGEPDGPNGPRGFFKFYRDLWDEKELGPKPVKNPIDLLEKDVDGKPIVQQAYRIGGMHEYWACLRNPNWQRVLKAWTKRAVERGVDGLIINYFYRHNCHCEHCQRGFRAYLSKRYTPVELKTKFQIADLKSHKFKELVCWHKPEESTLLRREMLRWSQISNKQVFDEVFVRYGRSLKPDLMLAQWDHLGNFSQIRGDERCLLPTEMWGRDETYLWYSAGGSAYYTDLKKKFIGDVTLQARYIRGAFDDKPFTIGKYEGTRIRSAIAELASNGGAPMGFYTRYHDPAARKEIVRYYQFLKKYDELYRANRSHAEAVLLYPRKQVHAGNVDAVETFRQLGKQLLEAHILFDVLPNELATKERLSQYRVVIDPVRSTNLPAFKAPHFSLFDAPFTIRVAASRPKKGNELTLHFVNYNRTEPKPGRNGRPSAGRGIVDEKPIAAEAVRASVVIPAGTRVTSVVAMTPESPSPTTLKFESKGNRVGFNVPSFLVYSVVRIQLQESK